MSYTQQPPCQLKDISKDNYDACSPLSIINLCAIVTVVVMWMDVGGFVALELANLKLCSACAPDRLLAKLKSCQFYIHVFSWDHDL